jgi:hypothetical protein
MPEEHALKLLDSVEPIIHLAMPIQDAIDLVHYLIETRCEFERFAPGVVAVAKPIDSAALTRHEEFLLGPPEALLS